MDVLTLRLTHVSLIIFSGTEGKQAYCIFFFFNLAFSPYKLRSTKPEGRGQFSGVG